MARSLRTFGGTLFSTLSPRCTVTSAWACAFSDRVTVTPSTVLASGPCARSAISLASIDHSSRIGSAYPAVRARFSSPMAAVRNAPSFDIGPSDLA
jgi:hypothetical protein